MITKAETAELLTYLAAGMQSTSHKIEVTPATVEVWHRQFAAARVSQPRIVAAAIDAHLGSDAARWGVTPADVVTRYKSITRSIAARTDGWQGMDYEQRQAILSDPAECDYSAGLTTTAQYLAQRQAPAAITGRSA